MVRDMLEGHRSLEEAADYWQDFEDDQPGYTAAGREYTRAMVLHAVQRARENPALDPFRRLDKPEFPTYHDAQGGEHSEF